MVKLICLNCGHIFDEEDTTVWNESRGEFWGDPCYEPMSGCPKCRSVYAETYECDECGKYIVGTYIKTENGQRICENCYNTYEIGEEHG